MKTLHIAIIGTGVIATTKHIPNQSISHCQKQEVIIILYNGI